MTLLTSPELFPTGRNSVASTQTSCADPQGGFATSAYRAAFDDWLMHLATNSDKQAALAKESVQLLRQLFSLGTQVGLSGAMPALQDRRFAQPGWKHWPFNVLSQSFLLTQQWWHGATRGVPGVSPHHQDMVSFSARQLLDIFSPANFLLTNPELLQRTAKTGGANLVHGLQNLVADAQRMKAKALPVGVDAFELGKQVAATPGQVIFRNHLIELIQYQPTCEKVRPEPILIVPAWIMKYYILDLSPGDSLIKYLVDQGYTVFAMSWRNPESEDRNLGMDDYLRLGVMDALDVVGAVVPEQKIHAVGYCLGGTLLTIAAAGMGLDGDGRLASVSLFAAQTDFTEPGELSLFIDEAQVTQLEASMREKGYLDNQQMASAFQLMSSTDLVWSRMLNDYLMGERLPVSDLMAWNADGTRLPLRMHSEYLRRLFLHNDLARGRYEVKQKPVTLNDITCPIFCVGTVRDHVAPWRSVYKLHALTESPLTFLLTSGGHNVGIVNPPGVPGRSYQVLTQGTPDNYLAPDAWLESAPAHEGSWWPCWELWLGERSGKPVAPPAMGAHAQGVTPLCAAPGTYVLQR
jgi:polyhydroxyalkanoate synthase subunit PhaC